MVLIILCLLTNASQCLSSLFEIISGLLTIGIVPLIGLLNKNIVGLCRTGSSGSDLICNNVICISDLSVNVFLWYPLWICYMLSPVHCSGDEMVMMTLALYLGLGRIF